MASRRSRLWLLNNVQSTFLGRAFYRSSRVRGIDRHLVRVHDAVLPKRLHWTGNKKSKRMPCDKFQDKIFDLLACVHYSWERSSHRICNSEPLNHQKWRQSTHLVHQHQNGWLWAFFVRAIPDAKLGLNGHRWPWSRCLPRLVASVKISLWYV